MSTLAAQRAAVLLLIAAASALAGSAPAQHEAGTAAASPDAGARRGPAHPAVVLLDAQGEEVRSSGAPLSTVRTCAGCHDTQFIDQHSYHAWLGANETNFTPARTFDTGPGPLERFDPLAYERFDRGADSGLTLPQWLQRHGALHIGGGFAASRADGTSLLEVPTPEQETVDGWDWSTSGVSEMNCFLCHIDQPDNEARIAELAAGRFGSAITATLANTGLVTRSGETWSWNLERLDDQGAALPGVLALRRPRNSNCGLCHGFVEAGAGRPFFIQPGLARAGAGNRRTEVTGQIISPHRIRRSGMNIAGKDDLSRPWDVHAEHLLGCVDCHGSINNPTTYSESAETRPQHLKRGVRHLPYSEYLYTPSHDFAKGHGSQGELANELDGSMRRCGGCHSTEGSHDWLPYTQRHLQRLQCEACHVPQLHAPARMQTDWTMLDSSGHEGVTYRGYAEPSGTLDVTSPASLIVGYEPVLLPREELDGHARLAPQNLATAYYWLDEGSGQPVPLERLRRALFVSAERPADGYRAEILAGLDRDQDGELRDAELRLVDGDAVDTVAAALVRAGAETPVIRGDLQPYGIHHGVAPGSWATRDCGSCHGETSRFSGSFQLGAYAPGGVLPTLVADASVDLAGEVRVESDGRLVYVPDPSQLGIGLLGSELGRTVDAIGRWAVLLTILGVLVHGGIRIFLHQLRKLPAPRPPTRPAEDEEVAA